MRERQIVDFDLTDVDAVFGHVEHVEAQLVLAFVVAHEREQALDAHVRHRCDSLVVRVRPVRLHAVVRVPRHPDEVRVFEHAICERAFDCRGVTFRGLEVHLCRRHLLRDEERLEPLDGSVLVDAGITHAAHLHLHCADERPKALLRLSLDEHLHAVSPPSWSVEVAVAVVPCSSAFGGVIPRSA